MEKVKWFRENFELDKGRSLHIAYKDILTVQQSKYQEIRVYDTFPFGKMLTLDGVIMLTEADNHAYHEMLVHVPMFSHPSPKTVLIVGGGDGGALKEILKHPTVERTVICEIDEDVIKVCREYFPGLADAYDDPRVELIVGDAAEYIASQDNMFDVICVDSSDPVGPAEVLFQKPFYQNLSQALTDEGIAVTQSESMYYHLDFIKSLMTQNREFFKILRYYFTMIPTYPSGTIGFSFCSKKFDPIKADINSATVNKVGPLKYYHPDIHKAAFVLPGFAKDILG